MPWEIFERAASGYEQWYETRRGRRADITEWALLRQLLVTVPQSRTVLEVGSGTGHFCAWLADLGFKVVGLDRAPVMVKEARREFALIPFLIGDALHLPLGAQAVDVVIFVTTLEFRDSPLAALREAVRVPRRGVVAIALNRRSLGDLSRRLGPQSRGSLLAQARDYSLSELRRELREEAGDRVATMVWSSTLFPNGLWNLRVQVPFGDVIGVAARLRPSVPQRP